MVNALGVIPARSGSKQIPHKNVFPLLGKPLLAYTCAAALQSRNLSRTILSTDSDAIADVGRACGIEVPFLRPSEIARDDTPMVDVLMHALSWLTREQGYTPEIIVLLQPTSPLRRASHIDEAVDLLVDSGADTVVSVVEVPHQFSPGSLMEIDRDGFIHPYLQQPMIFRRQDKPKVYARNGPAVLAVRRPILEQGQLYGSRVRAYEMSLDVSLDIDSLEDLALAEYFFSRHQSMGK
jgi:CMP-N-acetylneuraminic acid synthetase